MGKDQPLHFVFDRVARDLLDRSVTTCSTAKVNRPVPPRRLGKHQVGGFCPLGKDQEFGSPHDVLATGTDEIAIGFVRGVNDWARFNRKSIEMVASNVWV